MEETGTSPAVNSSPVGKGEVIPTCEDDSWLHISAVLLSLVTKCFLRVHTEIIRRQEKK